MSDAAISNYLNGLKDQLLASNSWQRFFKTKIELINVPEKAGVYVFRNELGNVVYVGETGNLRGRMRDLFDTRNHNLRRSIGKRFYSDHVTYFPATASKKFHTDVEHLVDQHLRQKLYFSYIEVPLGRKELETLIERNIPEEEKLNIRSERKTK